ncbi:MAG: hypothetical protein O3A51_04675 [Verrucomicrobia bacterium]|nr:hypothetical protein [Verrucomicrobiota bacterium]
MYYLAKGLQFAGILIVGVGFLAKFPDLMNPRLFMAGIIFCVAGWIVQRYVLKT